MIAFGIGAAVLVALVVLQLLRPFLWRSAATAGSAGQINTAIYREQLAKLDQDLAEGSISAADHAQARTELQRRAIDDITDDPALQPVRTPRKTLWGLGLSLPLAAGLLYLSIGNPLLLREGTAAEHAASQLTPADVERMVANLAERLEKEPDNLKGWAMLARSYKVMGRSEEAERAFARAGSYLDNDAQLLASYADVVASNANGDFSGKAQTLIDKALKVDPDNGMALWLAGTAAMRRGANTEAARHWEHLATLLPPDSEDARMIQGAIAEVRAKGGDALPAVASKSGAKEPVPATPGAGSGAKTVAASGATVSGTVSLAPTLQARLSPDDTVMVIARAPGQRMPLAVLRKRAAELPLRFTLDDSLAMSPQATLSTAAQVEVEARISKSGMAKPEPGDLMSAVQTVQPGAKGLQLLVDQVRP